MQNQKIQEQGVSMSKYFPQTDFDFLCFVCSDCRNWRSEKIDGGISPETVIFHKNPGNVVSAGDFSCLSILEYSLKIANVKKIIISGHYGCAAVAPALEECRLDFLGNWLIPAKNCARKYASLLEGISDKKRKIDALCELNVIEQVLNACKLSVVRDAWQENPELAIIGQITDRQGLFAYDLNICAKGLAELDESYDAAIADFRRRWQF